MFIALFFIFLPTSNTYKYYPLEVKRILFGDLGRLDDLFLPESTDNVTDSEMETIPKIDIRRLCSDSYVELPDPSNASYEEPQNITSDGEDAREYNEVLVRYNFTRKRVFYWWQGHYDRDDYWWLGWHIEEKKIKMFQKISLMYLYHTRRKIESAFKQREPMRRDKRYMLGYLFNRLRRLKTEMLKVVAIARQQLYEYGGFKRQFENLTSTMRLYESVVRHDTDIRDTTVFIKQIFNIRAPYDYIKKNDGGGGGKAHVTDPVILAQQEQAAKAPKNLDFGEQRYDLLLGNANYSLL